MADARGKMVHGASETDGLARQRHRVLFIRSVSLRKSRIRATP